MKKPFITIMGLCVIEDEWETYKVAHYLKKITSKYPDIQFIFKASFDKANRTSINSYRGIAIKKGKEILKKIKKFGIKTLTDIHNPIQAKEIAESVDVIQTPAFMCRQTDLITAAAKTGKTINIKKGQFIAPQDIKYIIEKIESTGNKKIMITERGTCFGYNNLVVDFRSFLIMKKYGYPIIFDATHSQQMPSINKGITGGNREFAIPMAKAAVAIGVDGLFLEVHPAPKKAMCDASTSLPLSSIPNLLKEIIKIRKAI